MEMLGMLLRSWPMMLVFLRLIVWPNSLHAHVKQLMSCCRASSVCAVGAAASANSSSLISTLCTLIFCSEACEAEESSSASVVDVYAIFWLNEGIDSSKEKKMPKGVSASMHPCFTLFLIRKRSKEEPSYWTVPCKFSWKDVIILWSWGGHPILCSRVKRPFLLTKSKALIRSITQCTEVTSAHSTSLGADVVRRSCQLLIFQPWIYTALLGKHTQQALVTCSAPCRQRPYQQCWGGRFHSNCHSCCSHPCSCIRWWCLHCTHLGAQSPLPSTVAEAHGGGGGGQSTCQPWWLWAGHHLFLELCFNQESQWPCSVPLLRVEHQALPR